MCGDGWGLGAHTCMVFRHGANAISTACLHVVFRQVGKKYTGRLHW